MLATILIYIYPLRAVFGSMWFLFSDGRVGQALGLRADAQARTLFATFAIGFTAIALEIVLLNVRAWQLREPLRLNERERLMTRDDIAGWSLPAGVGNALEVSCQRSDVRGRRSAVGRRRSDIGGKQTLNAQRPTLNGGGRMSEVRQTLNSQLSTLNSQLSTFEHGARRGESVRTADTERGAALKAPDVRRESVVWRIRDWKSAVGGH